MPSGIAFWAAVVTGWFFFPLVWRVAFKTNYGLVDMNEDCVPCVDRICQKCSSDESVPTISQGKDAYYRDFPWKPLNLVETRAASWKMISKKYRDGMQNDDPRVGINGMWRLEQEQLESRLKDLTSKDLKFKAMMRKFDPFRGVSYIAHAESSKSKDPEILELLRKFQPDKPVLVDIDQVDKTETVYIIMPLSKVTQRFHSFLKRLEENFYSSNRQSHEKLIFVIFGERGDKDTTETIQALTSFQKNNPNVIMEHTVIKGDFSRAIGLHEGVKMCPPDALMLFLDVDLIISQEFMDRIRASTIESKQVVFPLVFSQFDPHVIEAYVKSQGVNEEPNSDSNIGVDKGFWIHYAFGITSMYKSDYIAVGGFALDIVGWGGEDVNLFKKFISSPTITVMSAVDPDLIHIYHSRGCDPNLSPDQYRMCIGSLSETIGSQTQLSSLYLQKKAGQYFKDLTPE